MGRERRQVDSGGVDGDQGVGAAPRDAVAAARARRGGGGGGVGRGRVARRGRRLLGPGLGASVGPGHGRRLVLRADLVARRRLDRVHPLLQHRDEEAARVGVVRQHAQGAVESHGGRGVGGRRKVRAEEAARVARGHRVVQGRVEGVPFLDGTRQVDRPGRRLRPGSSDETSTSDKSAPSDGSDSSAATTASSSSGFREHVLYTMRPPGASKAAQRAAILNCSACSPIPCAADHLRHTSGDLRRVPSPEQGTSARTRSKRTGEAPFAPPPGVGKKAASWQETTSPGDANLAVVCASMLARRASRSLATTQPAASGPPRANASRIWAVFDPGDAHASSTM